MQEVSLSEVMNSAFDLGVKSVLEEAYRIRTKLGDKGAHSFNVGLTELLNHYYPTKAPKMKAQSVPDTNGDDGKL